MNAPRDEAVAHMAGFENVFDAQIVSTDEHLGVMICQISGTGLILEVPLAHCAPGDRIRVGVRAGDILLASERPQGISARNVFPGRVVSLKRHDYLMEAVVETGTLFRTHLTLGAAQNLRLEVGCSTWILIKTHSCRLLRAANGSAALSDLPIEVVRKPADLDQSEGVSALREVGILSQPTAVPIAAQSESA
jgi:molybdate transport system ATP-binding protein